MKTTIVLVFLLISNYSIYAQIEALDRIIPPAPTAASFAKFQDIPVSYYTGIPNISIPIYEAKNDELRVPISLNYHSGGIKVGEEASWVGLGWNLGSGGVITRVVRGSDDLPMSSGFGFPDSYMPTSVDPVSNKYITPTNTTERQRDELFLRDAADGLQDSEPDVFVYNFNGRSGKFILNKRTSINAPYEAVLMSQEDVKIKVVYMATKSNYEWTITDELGNRYVFGTVEKTVSRSGMAQDEESADLAAPEGLPSSVVSSWYLDKIISPKGAEINFIYEYSNLGGLGTKQVLSRSQEKKHVRRIYNSTGACTVMANTYNYFSTYTENLDVYLKAITFPNGKIEFKTSNRADIEPVSSSNPTYAKKLDSIVCWQEKKGILSRAKKFAFTYGYFGAGNDYKGKRLKLLNVVEKSVIENKEMPPYLFDYNPKQLPNKDSKDIDHWGYYNGANNDGIRDRTYGDIMSNGTLVPPYSMYIPQNGQTWNFPGADREANNAFAQACMLTDITYPTGVKTHFDFELNEYYAPNVEIREHTLTAFLQWFGEETNIKNADSNSQLVQLESPATVLVTSSVQCYDGGDCLSSSGMEYEYDVVRIESLPGTPYYNQGIGYLLTTENQSDGTTQEMEIELPAGQYKFTVHADENYVSRMWLEWPGENDTVHIYNHNGGGLRIKKISSLDGLGPNTHITNFEYSEYKEDIRCSTGKLMSTPSYTYMEHIRKECGPGVYDIAEVDRVVRSSHSIIPISGSANGNSVGYDKVTVWEGDQGKTVYEYLNVSDWIPNLPEVPTRSYIGNGLLERQTIYSKTNQGEYRKIKEISNKYEDAYDRQRWVKAMKIPKSDLAFYVFNGSSHYHYKNVEFYDIYSESIRLTSDTVRTYSQSDDAYSVVITDYTYGNPNWLALTEKTTKTSDNKTYKTTYKYPYDFSSIGVYQNMVASNQIGQVIEESNFLNAVPLKSVRTNYTLNTNNKPLPSSIDVKIGGGNYEIRNKYISYSTDGKLLEETFDNGSSISYLWGYQGQYLIAEVKNATQGDVAYSSFEAEGKGNWIYNGTTIADITAPTGRKVYNLGGGSISRGGLTTSKKYLLSYWAKSPSATGISGGTATAIGSLNGWTHYQRILTGSTSVTLSGTVYIDEVRLHPLTASMTTYTYDPLVGMTSSTDASGRTTYYEYDGFGRLQRVKDMQQRPVSDYQYHYRNQ